MRYSGDHPQYHEEVEIAQIELSDERVTFFKKYIGLSDFVLEYIYDEMYGEAINFLKKKGIEVCAWEIPLILEELEEALNIE